MILLVKVIMIAFCQMMDHYYWNILTHFNLTLIYCLLKLNILTKDHFIFLNFNWTTTNFIHYSPNESPNGPPNESLDELLVIFKFIAYYLKVILELFNRANRTLFLWLRFAFKSYLHFYMNSKVFKSFFFQKKFNLTDRSLVHLKFVLNLF